MKFFVNKYTAIYDPSSMYGRLKAFRYLVDRDIVECEFPENVQIIKTDRGPRTVTLCTYSDGVKPDITGFIHVECLDEFHENLPHGEVVFENKTISSIDAEQYINYEGFVQYNLCGQSCVAYALGLSLGEVLEQWKEKDYSIWSSFFNRKYKARGTSDGELQRLSQKLGVDASLLSDAIKMKESGDVRYTPSVLAKLIKNGTVICSVNVDGAYHRLRGSGILHWVVIVDVFEERTYGGTVTIWNSLSNSFEIYSWNEFLVSARQPYGIFVKNPSLGSL